VRAEVDAGSGVRHEAVAGNGPPDHRGPAASAVVTASMVWAFTQHEPLDTGAFITEASRRGVQLDLPVLRELYRRNLLIPFVSITYLPVAAPSVASEPEPPRRGGTRFAQLKWARDTGRLRDLSAVPFMPRLPFERRRQRARDWWNGLLYSWYQLLVLPEIDGLLAYRRDHRRGVHRSAWLPQPHPVLLGRAAKLRTTAIALTALEARYLPVLDPEWIQLVNADAADWRAYRDGFDPVLISRQLGYTAAQARQDADWLLLRAHRLDPAGDSWSRLIRRAPSRAWEGLKDAALSAMDYRVAVEILLLFYEDLAASGLAEPLPEVPPGSSHHLRYRLSHRDRTLDEDLTHLGISPHPRVVLAVEGETEEAHIPLVWKVLDYPDAPELMRLLKLGGVDRDLEKVAALAAAPLISGKAPGRAGWLLIKPPTCLYIAVDPEGQYFAPGKVIQTRTAILNEIKAVLKAQGVTGANPGGLDVLVKIHTWSQSCYEFAHFTDKELAEGIMAVHTTIDGWSRDQLVAALSDWRRREKDIKRVWESGRWDEQQHRMSGKWDYDVSKTELAMALWPVLKAKIERCRTDPTAPIPEIADVIHDAYLIAQRWRYHPFALSAESDRLSKVGLLAAIGGVWLAPGRTGCWHRPFRLVSWLPVRCGGMRFRLVRGRCGGAIPGRAARRARSALRSGPGLSCRARRRTRRCRRGCG